MINRPKKPRTTSSLLATLLLASLLVWSPTAQAKQVLPTPDEIDGLASAHVGERWYGIYLKGTKIGWQREKWTRTEGATCVDSEFILEMAFLGKKSETHSSETSCFEGTYPHLMTRHVGVMTNNGRETRVAGKLEEGELRLSVTTDAGTRTNNYSKDSNRLFYLIPWAGLGRMEPGDYVDSFTFDERTGKKRWQKVTYLKSEEMMLLGRKQKVSEIRIEDEVGLSVEAFLSKDGVMLQGTMGPSLRFVLEDKKTALSREAGLLDLHESSMIKATGEGFQYRRVADARRLHVLLKGAGKIRLAQTPRQTVVQKSDDVVEVTIDACPKPSVDKTSLAGHLECNPDIPCDDPRIQKMAQEIGANAPTVLDKALALTAWIHKNFRYQLGSNGTTADQILKDRTGDCSEFSKAGVLLARSAKIPSRLVSGIVMASGKPLAFAYHAWLEVWIEGKGWVAVDPTWGLFPVDATHIVFDVDEGLLMATHFGGLQVEILDVELSPEGELKCD